jgi:hypothetical protein
MAPYLILSYLKILKYNKIIIFTFFLSLFGGKPRSSSYLSVNMSLIIHVGGRALSMFKDIEMYNL